MDKWLNGCGNEWMIELINLDCRMNTCRMHEWIKKFINGWMNEYGIEIWIHYIMV